MTRSTNSGGRLTFDAVAVEVLKHELSVICEEMALTISRTARSTMVRSGDFAAALVDPEGHVVGQGYAAPIQLAQFMSLMEHVTAKLRDDLVPGDIIIANDPYQGWGHMPDIAVARPLFWADELAGFTVAYSHQTDIGGRFPGGMSSEPSVSYEEGVRLPIVKLYEGGSRNDQLLDVILANVRGPDDWIGDVEAKMAGCRRGAMEFEAVLDRHGVEAFREYCVYANDWAEEACRNAIQEIPDGDYELEHRFEETGPGIGDEGVLLRMRLSVRDDELVLDFTGTDPQVSRAINLPFGQTIANCYGSFKVLVDPDVPMNAGFTRPITIEAPEGCVVHPVHPAAVGGRGALASRVRGLVFQVLAQALPGKIPVPSDGANSLHAFGKDPDGGSFSFLDGFFNGWGGRPDQDGIDGVTPIEFGAYGVTSAELIEREYPIVLEEFAYVPDSAGPGRHRGSLALARTWRFLAPAHAMLRTTRLTPSHGFAGGESAVPSASRIVRADGSVDECGDRMHWHFDVEPGDRVEHVMGGTGGHGDPGERDPVLIRADIKNGRLTPDGARAQYGFDASEDAEFDAASSSRPAGGNDA